MNRRYLMIALAVITGMVLLTGCRFGSHGEKHAFALDYIKETLDLTQSQEADLAEIHKEVRAKIADLDKDKAAMKETLKAQIAADEMDEAVISSLVDRHREKMNQVVDLVVDRLMAFHKKMTPDQKAKFLEKMEKFEKWCGSRS